jgi:hypothetical protein
MEAYFYTAVLIVIIIFILALLISRKRKNANENLLTPRVLARRFDINGIITYCRNEIHNASYTGIMRGAYGSLWAGEANAWDRLLLANAVLEAKGVKALIVPGAVPRLAYRNHSWTVVRLDADEPAETSDHAPEGAVAISQLLDAQPQLVHEIVATLVLENNDGDTQRVEPAKPERVADWVYQPVILSVSDEGQGVYYVLRIGDRKVLTSGPLNAVRRASLALSWRFNGQTTVWNRELFDRAVISATGERELPGHDVPRAGDRYAIVLAAGSLVPEVSHTRLRMLEIPEYTPLNDTTARTLIDIATGYLVKSDERALSIAKETHVTVAWSSPRIAIAASETRAVEQTPAIPTGANPTGTNRDAHPSSQKGAQSSPLSSELGALSLDALADAVEAEGKRVREFHLARGLANDLAETQVIYEATKTPVVSASTLFARYAASSVLETPQRHIDALRAEAERLLTAEPNGTQVKLKIGPPRALQTSTPTSEDSMVSIQRTVNGLALNGVREEMNPSSNDRSGGYAFDLASSVAFGSDWNTLSVAAESVLEQITRFPDYQLSFELVRAIPLEPVPLMDGSTLIYRAQLRAESESKGYRLAVQVSQSDGALGGSWFDLDSGRYGRVAGTWPEVMGRDAAGPIVGVFLTQQKDENESETTRFKLHIGKTELEIEARKIRLPDGASITVLPLGDTSLVLEWRKADASLVLQSMSPVVRGRVVDADTGLSVVGALVSRISQIRSRTEVKAAGDGSFAIPITSPLFQRLILVLDRSGSMNFGLDPKADRDAPSGEERRIDALRHSVHALLDRVPPATEVALWTFATPGRFYGDYCSPELTDVEVDFTPDLAAIRRMVDRITPGGGTPTTGAVIKVLGHMKENPASREAIVVLLTDGENSCENETMARAYKKRNGQIHIHSIGFAIEPRGKAERDLRALSEASGGTFHTAGTGDELRLTFQEFARGLETIQVQASAAGYEPAEATLKTATQRQPPLKLRLTASHTASHTPGFLTVGRDNLSDLDHAQGLSPKARNMIAERVREGTWIVTIPRQRVGMGSITAYGWFESETATGRLVGRTEDGLHGSIIDPHNWPLYKNVAGKHPFVAWFEGITAYTTGSVLAAMSWHRERGYSVTVDDFKIFVQANALEFASGWWDEVGSKSYGNMIEVYWAGVCLNFGLQSMAMALKSDSCKRCWAFNLCKSMQSELTDDVKKELTDALKKAGGILTEPALTVLKASSSPSVQGLAALAEYLREKGSDKLAEELMSYWDDALTKGFDCQRLLKLKDALKQ